MLLYITAEDVFGSETPERRGPRPLHTIPETVAGLFDLGLRHHVRRAALAWWAEGSLEPVPDWRLDRRAIRIALFARERMGLEPGGRLVVLGRLGGLWPAVDFAAMGFGVVPVGIEHDVGDDALASVVAEAAPRAAFATDAASAERLRVLRRAGRLGDATVVGESLPREEGLLPLTELLDLGSVLDTAERAQAFRAFSRQVAPEAPALWHAGPRGIVRLTHREAMARIEPRLRSRPACEGDVAYLDAPRATLRKRLALAAFVGDGHTTTALGREERVAEDVAELRPHKVVASEPWLAAVCDGRGPRWPGGLDRSRAGRRVQEALGGRLRWVETGSAPPEETLRALAAAGVTVDVRDDGPGGGSGYVN
jgi:long-subunit acyl-CoA synthetase (AMP-forming)